LFVDDLPASPVISRLRAEGVVNADTRLTEVAFGEGNAAFKRWVGVAHQTFRNGGSWSLYICTSCRGRARVLRLFEGRPICRRCCLRRGLRYRIEGGSPAERAKARRARIERLRRLLNGNPARLHPRPGRVLDRRGSLEMSLRRALIAARQDLLK
jgi:hypothetical protein